MLHSTTDQKSEKSPPQEAAWKWARKGFVPSLQGPWPAWVPAQGER